MFSTICFAMGTFLLGRYLGSLEEYRNLEKAIIKTVKNTFSDLKK